MNPKVWLAIFTCYSEFGDHMKFEMLLSLYWIFFWENVWNLLVSYLHQTPLWFQECTKSSMVKKTSKYKTRLFTSPLMRWRFSYLGLKCGGFLYRCCKPVGVVVHFFCSAFSFLVTDLMCLGTWAISLHIEWPMQIRIYTKFVPVIIFSYRVYNYFAMLSNKNFLLVIRFASLFKCIPFRKWCL